MSPGSFVTFYHKMQLYICASEDVSAGWRCICTITFNLWTVSASRCGQHPLLSEDAPTPH